MIRRALLLVFAIALPGACSREQSAGPVATPIAKLPASAVDLLDVMDQRKPVPLLPMMAAHQKENMRGHLLAVQEIVLALASDDFGGVERAAARIGFSEETGQMCTHMGAAAPGFAEQSLAFHHTADLIAVAARERDRTRVLAELGATLDTCTSCHATWKQQLVDESTWRKLTSAGSAAR